MGGGIFLFQSSYFSPERIRMEVREESFQVDLLTFLLHLMLPVSNVPWQLHFDKELGMIPSPFVAWGWNREVTSYSAKPGSPEALHLFCC